MSPAGTIAVVATRMWGRELCRILRVPPPLAAGVAVLTVVGAFLFGGLLASVTVSRVGDDFPADAVPIIARASLAGVWVTSGLITTVFVVTAPPRTTLRSLLDLLPVRRRAAVAAILLARDPVTADLARALATLAPVIPFALGVHAIGRSLPTRWIVGHVAPDRRAWAVAAAAAVGVVGAVVSGLLLLAVVIAGVAPIEIVPQVAVRAALSGTLALLAGAAIPVSTEQPVSATASAFLFGVLLLGSSVALGAVTDAGGSAAAMVLATAAGVGTFLLYLLVCARHPSLDRTHG